VCAFHPHTLGESLEPVRYLSEPEDVVSQGYEGKEDPSESASSKEDEPRKGCG
jgi:hypothetical protein